MVSVTDEGASGLLFLFTDNLSHSATMVLSFVSEVVRFIEVSRCVVARDQCRNDESLADCCTQAFESGGLWYHR